MWRESELFTELRRPQTGGACQSCSAFDACRGGCMAAKFFTGLPLDGPDPECVKGHGERALADVGASARSRRWTTRTDGRCRSTIGMRRPDRRLRREPTRRVHPMTRVALVTGAARGIGAATCWRSPRGWAVLAVDRAEDDPALPYPMGTETELSTVVDAAGERVAAYLADVRDGGALEAAVAQAQSRRGGLDAAIAAAGVIAGGSVVGGSVEQQQAVLDMNLGGVVNLARAAMPALLRRPAPRSGRFLAVASAAATRGSADAGRLLRGQGRGRPG